MRSPTNVPNLNSGKEWSSMDLDDLRNHNARGASIHDTAEFRCRSQAEVFAKSRELGVPWSLKQRKKDAQRVAE